MRDIIIKHYKALSIRNGVEVVPHVLTPPHNVLAFIQPCWTVLMVLLECFKHSGHRSVS